MSDRRLATKAGSNLLNALDAMTGSRDRPAWFAQIAAIEAEAATPTPDDRDREVERIADDWYQGRHKQIADALNAAYDAGLRASGGTE